MSPVTASAPVQEGGGKRSVIKIVVLEFSIQNAESPLNILLSEE